MTCPLGTETISSITNKLHSVGALEQDIITEPNVIEAIKHWLINVGGVPKEILQEGIDKFILFVTHSQGYLVQVSHDCSMGNWTLTDGLTLQLLQVLGKHI